VRKTTPNYTCLPFWGEYAINYSAQYILRVVAGAVGGILGGNEGIHLITKRNSSMPEPLIASTQYGDMLGTVQFDGHEAAPLEELAALTEMPPNFCAIAITMGLPNTEEEKVPFSILAYDYNLLGMAPNSIENYIDQNGQLPLVEYKSHFLFSQFDEYFKRWSLAAYHKSVAGMIGAMKVYSPDEWSKKQLPPSLSAIQPNS
jgi:hypothetical protein